MKRQKQLNEKTLEKARKEKEKVLKLLNQIDKANKQIKEIRDSNRWMAYLDKDFDKNATEEQIIEFFNDFKVIR